MIKERYVNLEVARLLRDKGFDEECNGIYEYSDNTLLCANTVHTCRNSELGGFIAAPTQSMACEWVERKHHYIIDVHLDVESEEASSWVWSVYERINVEGREPYAILYFEDDEPYEFDNQEFAYNDAIKYVLTNLV